MHNYNDDRKEAIKNMTKLNKSRSNYYQVIANSKWGSIENYDICINCSIGNEKVVELLADYIKNSQK